MTGMDRLNKQIYYTYHSKKNEEVLPIVLFFSAIALICKAVLLFEMIIWMTYLSYCKKNNSELENDLENLKRREFLLEFKREIESGERKFKE